MQNHVVAQPIVAMRLTIGVGCDLAVGSVCCHVEGQAAGTTADGVGQGQVGVGLAHGHVLRLGDAHLGLLVDLHCGGGGVAV